MYLFVNTTTEGEIFLALLDEKGIIKTRLKKTISKPLSEVLLSALDHFLKSKTHNLKSLLGILIVPGPGRFTTLRVTLATLNTIAWQLKIPILTTSSDALQKLDLKKLISRIKNKKFNKTALPLYGLPPSITMKKNA